MIIIRRASRNNIPAIAELLTQGVSRKQGYSDGSWGTDPFTNDEVADIFDTSRVYIATINGKVIGVVAITNKDELWEDVGKPSKAWYVHRLTSDQNAKGQNVGGLLLKQLEEDALRQGVSALRLDCDYHNEGLCNYYIRQGFVEVTRKDLHNKITGATDGTALFEKKIP